MVLPSNDAPWGMTLINRITQRFCQNRRVNKLAWHRGGVLALTYLAYTCYHMSRKPISVVKNVLNLNCSSLSPPPDIIIDDKNKDTWCDWAPFGKSFISIIKRGVGEFQIIENQSFHSLYGLLYIFSTPIL